MITIIRTGGKQYIVHPGQTLKVEKLPAANGSTAEFEVLLRADQEETSNPAVSIGTPFIAEKTPATVVSEIRTKKIAVVKYKRKVRYRRRTGHRQTMSQVKIS